MVLLHYGVLYSDGIAIDDGPIPPIHPARPHIIGGLLIYRLAGSDMIINCNTDYCTRMLVYPPFRHSTKFLHIASV